MKINEVEAQVGITKKNLRFYEEQGLIAPRRNSENGYREYGPREVDQLRQVKLLRKLGVPLEEIRKMQSGTHTVGDGMRRHLVTLERDKKNLEQSIQLCRTLSDRDERLDDLDAAAAEIKAAGVDTFMTPEKKVLPHLFGGLENWFFTGPSGEQIELLHML